MALYHSPSSFSYSRKLGARRARARLVGACSISSSNRNRRAGYWSIALARGRAFEFSCCPGGRDICIFVRARDHKSFLGVGNLVIFDLTFLPGGREFDSNLLENVKIPPYQSRLFAVSEINKIGIGFISIFLLKARVSYLTNLKRKNLSLPLKNETDQFVICLVLPECLTVKIAFYPRTAVKRIVTALMPSFLFHCFSLLLPHLTSSPWEKVAKLSSFCS